MKFGLRGSWLRLVRLHSISEMRCVNRYLIRAQYLEIKGELRFVVPSDDMRALLTHRSSVVKRPKHALAVLR